MTQFEKIVYGRPRAEVVEDATRAYAARLGLTLEQYRAALKRTGKN